MEKKIQRSWDASEVEANQALIHEIAEILKRYPNLTLCIKGISDGSGSADNLTQVAFAKDFETDFPTEVMDKTLQYYLRAFTQDTSNRWDKLLKIKDFAKKIAVNAFIGETPFYF